MLLKSKKLKENITGLIFIAPFMLVFLVFLGWPVIYSFILSFHKATIHTDWYNVFDDMKFVGFKHYATILFQEKEFWWSIITTFIYALITIPTGIAASLLLAIVLNNKLKGVSFFRSAFFLPNVLDMLVIGIIWTLIFAPKYGLADFLMQKISVHIFENSVLDNPYTVLPAIGFAMVLKGMGFGMILFLTSIQNISASVYEAADIDGANWFQKTIYITVPLVKPIILFMVITGTIAALNAFTEIYAMTNDTGGPAIEVMGESLRAAKLSGYYLFRTFKDGFYGKAAAISYILLIIASVISIINAKIIKIEK